MHSCLLVDDQLMSKTQKGFYGENFLGNDTFTVAENQFRVVSFCVI